uniref:HECT-type E3 ubiquitin transferase n=1 Tax=Percolomonas cosmopolitus TaxID=63605 RepID=A0A7S1KNI6_9EUKA|mmetsp:Transcript_2326/g.8685  ORF Transcript_2326/g.8685 Transcript_2326/m.8685 type:complete len:751 (+) Transcript_2326:185-2437(+)
MTLKELPNTLQQFQYLKKLSILTLRQLFDLTVRVYFDQFTNGCYLGDSCTNSNYCLHKNSAFSTMPPEEVAKQAIAAARDAFQQEPKFHFCDSPSPVLPLLSPHGSMALQTPVITRFAVDHLDFFSQIVERVFKHSDSINHSFLTRSAILRLNDFSHDSGINTDQVEEFYRIIQEQERKQHPELTKTMQSGFTSVAATLRKTANRILDPFKLRQFIIMLLSPYMMENEYYDCVLDIFTSSVNLNDNMQKILIKWFNRLQSESLLKIVRMVQQFITLQIYARYIVDEQIMFATIFLGMLNDANEMHENESEKIDYKEFYNDAVNNIFDLKSDTKRWRELKPMRQSTHLGNRPAHFSNFTFIDYPFILDPSAKSKVLSINAQFEQMDEVRGAIFSSFLGGGLQQPYLVLQVDRNNLISSCLYQIEMNRNNLKKPLKVKFIGEEGQDEGGVRKEMFLLIVRELFNENYGMFAYNKLGGNFWFNENTLSMESEFNLIGTVIGLALYNSIILDVRFPLLLYKKLCGQQPTLEDVKQADPELYRGLKQLLAYTGDVENDFCRNFMVETEAFGEVRSFELKPGGEDIPVTKENREEYVELYVKWKYITGVQKQFDAFNRGFRSVIGETLELFKPQELELLVCGSPKLDFDELKKGARYSEGYTEDSQQIHWLWDILTEFNEDEKRRFLHFCTGSDRSPISGLSSTQLVVIPNGDDDQRLPSASTCFNLLLLPKYTSKDILRDRLTKAIEHYLSFGLS